MNAIPKALAMVASLYGIRPAWTPPAGVLLGSPRRTYLYDDSASATLYHDLTAFTASGVNEPIATNGVSDDWVRTFGIGNTPPVIGIVDSIKSVNHDQPMAELENFELWSTVWRSAYLEIDDGKSNEKIPIEASFGFPHETGVSNGTAAVISYGVKVAEDMEFEGGSRFVDLETYTTFRVVYDAANNTLGADSDVSYYMNGLFLKKTVQGAAQLVSAAKQAREGNVDPEAHKQLTIEARRAKVAKRLATK